MSKVLVYIADGMEEVECLSVVDMLRRGGVETQMVSINGKTEVIGAHSIRVGADCLLADSDPDGADMLFLPGGMPGTKYLRESPEVCDALKAAAAAGKHLAAICAAPSVLGELHLLEGKKATCYPGFEDRLLGAEYCHDGVVTDGAVTTSRGVGFAVDLGLELVRILQGEEKSAEIRESIQHP